ncbi:PRC-barrel domain-containing protein [Microvirga roseola]|uniref:PRC-barrel domain-containing protein n=1 Tax=Microvirga roseola TaxID=2883126 RepID=UPI001E4CA6BD|nr:PRC-barrel domain-containing protein [Microvirga roseola]
MLKKHMAACLIATAFAAAPALAQTSTTQSAPTDRPVAAGSGSTTTGSPAMQPGSAAQPGTTTLQPTNPSAGSSTMGSSNTGAATMNQSASMQSGQFMTRIEQGQMMASDLIGTRVISANNESIGDINDVIVDRNGQAVAAVIGVGGFLGIGEKDVAVPFSALEFASEAQASAMSGDNNGNVTTTGSTAGTTGATTGTTGAVGGATVAAGADADDNQPDRVILRMTKAELQAAPSFDEDGDDNAGNATTGTTGTSGSGVQPVTPSAPQQ